jgi:hypothetical protein
MYWLVSDLLPFSTSQSSSLSVRMRVLRFPPHLHQTCCSASNGVMKGYKLALCISTGSCKDLGLHTFKENWLATSGSPFVVVFKKGHMHYRKRVLRQQLKAVGEDSNTVGEGFPNRVSELLLGKSRWRFK